MKRWIFLLSLIVVGCAGPVSFDRGQDVQSSPSPANSEENTLTLSFLDVGQGDATLISSSDETMLIDAGPPDAGRAVVLPFLKQQGVKELKYIVATHYHEDHIGGIPEVIKENFSPTNGVLDRGGGYENDTPSYEEYAKTTAGIRNTVHPGDHYTLGKATIDVLAANGEFADGEKIALEPFDENSAGIVFLLTDGDFKYLHESDLTGGGGDPPYQTIDLETKLGELSGDIDVLRVAHHGSQTSTNEDFLEAVTPEAAIISVGDENDFGHPSDEVVDRLLETGADIYFTERGWLDDDYINNDAITIEDDTITLEVSDEGRTIE